MTVVAQVRKRLHRHGSLSGVDESLIKHWELRDPVDHSLDGSASLWDPRNGLPSQDFGVMGSDPWRVSLMTTDDEQPAEFGWKLKVEDVVQP